MWCHNAQLQHAGTCVACAKSFSTFFIFLVYDSVSTFQLSLDFNSTQDQVLFSIEFLFSNNFSI